MNEEFIIYLWQHKLFNVNNLIESETGDRIQLINVGTRNYDSGPDFFNARIKISDTIWAGNVEVHYKSSDWFKHKHHTDAAYDNIILHVVYMNDMPVSRENGELIPTFQVKNNFDLAMFHKYTDFISNSNWIPCSNQLSHVNEFTQIAWLESLCIERLGIKSKAIEKELKQTQHDFQEIFYRQLCRSFGFNTNGHAFELLAKSLPFQVLSKHIDRNEQVEAFLFGQAGMLKKPLNDAYPKALSKEYTFLSEKYQLKEIDPKLWKFLRMRPSNFPTIRLSQLAKILKSTSGLLTELFEIERLNDLKSLLRIDANDYWKHHSDFDKPAKPKSISLGEKSVNIILINTIIPFAFVYGNLFDKDRIKDKAILWYEQIKPEKNSVIDKFKTHGLRIENAKHSQAALQLKKNYCDRKKCLECRFGHTLIRRKP